LCLVPKIILPGWRTENADSLAPRPTREADISTLHHPDILILRRQLVIRWHSIGHSLVDTLAVFLYFLKVLVEVRRPGVAEQVFPISIGCAAKGVRPRGQVSEALLIAAETVAIADLAAVGVPV